jgi:hypothetical protein
MFIKKIFTFVHNSFFFLSIRKTEALSQFKIIQVYSTIVTNASFKSKVLCITETL